MRLDLACACASTYTHSKAAKYAAAAALVQLGTLRWELARLRGLSVWDRGRFKALCFAYEVSALQRDVVKTSCLYSKSLDRKRSYAFEASAAPSEPFS